MHERDREVSILTDHIITVVLTSMGTAAALLVIFIFVPEKVEKWAALICKCWYSLTKTAHKTYVKHDVQSHVNDFVRRRTSELPGFYAKGVRLEWATEETTREAFLKSDEVIVRISPKHSDAQNIALAMHMFVSKSLLHRAKRYISPSQGRATDLYVTTQLLREQKPDVVDYFLETFLHPGLGDSHEKTLMLYQQFESIDAAGVFFHVYIRELDSLGRKVFGKRKSDQIIREVKELIDFLERFSTRRIGADSDLFFQKDYCKFALMIVGRREVVTASITPYLDYINNHVQPQQIETLYLLGPQDRVEPIRQILYEIRAVFECVSTHKYVARLNTDKGEVKAPTYLAVLRTLEDTKVVNN